MVVSCEVKAFRITNLLLSRAQCAFTVEAFLGLWVGYTVICSGFEEWGNVFALEHNSSRKVKLENTFIKNVRENLWKICLQFFPYNNVSKMTVIPEIWSLYTLNPKWPLDLPLSFKLLLRAARICSCLFNKSCCLWSFCLKLTSPISFYFMFSRSPPHRHLPICSSLVVFCSFISCLSSLLLCNPAGQEGPIIPITVSVCMCVFKEHMRGFILDSEIGNLKVLHKVREQRAHTISRVTSEEEIRFQAILWDFCVCVCVREANFIHGSVIGYQGQLVSK